MNILEEVQIFVADKLNADPQLSACQFLVENKKDIDYEIKNALGKQGIVGLVMTPKATYAGAYQDIGIAWQIDELEIDIVENVTVNRGKKDGYVTGQDAAMRLFDVMCPLSGDCEGQFSPVSYQEGEDGNLLVNKCLMKCLVHKVKEQPWTPTSQCVVFSDGESVDLPVEAIPSPEALDDWLFGIGKNRTNIVKVGAFSVIGSQTFFGCTNLTDIFISQDVQMIGNNAFENCGNVKTAYFKGRSIEDVRAMQNYPFGITDTDVIHAEL